MKVRMLEKYIIYRNRSKSKLLHFFKKLFFKNTYIIETKYLIERFYKNTNFSEYLICSDYDFRSNTFPSRGISVFDMQLAYKIFNHYVNHNDFPILDDIDDEVTSDD